MGAYIDTDLASGRQTITETFTCPHHNTIHPLYDEAGRRLDVMLCRKCMKPVCDDCVRIESSGGNMCLPFEKRLDRFEGDIRSRIGNAQARAAFMRACGIK